MHDNWLVAIAMTVAALGIGGLLLVLILLDPSAQSLEQTKLLTDDTPVQVKGEVLVLRSIGNSTLLTITAPSTIDVLINQPLNMTKGSCIMVHGKKTSYKNNPQVEANKVISC